MTPRAMMGIGSILGALAVAAGAFGAHALRESLEPRMLEIFETGARYHLIHALVLIAAGVVGLHAKGRAAGIAGWLLTAGVVIFSGSLYALVLTGVRTWGAVTPIGGVLLIAGWVSLAVAGFSIQSRQEAPR